MGIQSGQWSVKDYYMSQPTRRGGSDRRIIRACIVKCSNMLCIQQPFSPEINPKALLHLLANCVIPHGSPTH